MFRTAAFHHACRTISGRIAWSGCQTDRDFPAAFRQENTHYPVPGFNLTGITNK
jgi:hypothetical protein